MKNNVILSIVFILLMGCYGQKKEKIKPINSTIVMKKLDSNYFNKIKEINKENKKIQFTENDTVIELTDGGDFFFETKRKNNESICVFFSYDKKNHLMITSGTRFYDSSIDIFRRYNEKGEIIEEINRNENFPFSVYDLLEKIKITHQINLNDGELDRHVFRGIDKETNKPIYEINYEINKNDGTYKYITVDGETGQILSEGNSQFL